MSKGYHPLKYRYRAEKHPAKRDMYLRYWTKRHQKAKKLPYRLHVPEPYYSNLMCIHGGEGAWNSYNSAGPYYGGLQMDHSFYTTYGARFVAKHGGADPRYWTPMEQLYTGYKAVISGRGYSPWPNTAHACGLL